MSNICSICPRDCRATRDQDSWDGICGSGTSPSVARAALHFGEEPCITGTRGSGTVFFSGCNLRCVYCQNMELSFGHIGKTVTIERLRAIYRELAAQGAHNINLVTATHFTDAVAKSLEPPPPIPVAWNSSGYESVETLRRLDGRVQIYMPDYKYALSEPAEKYSNAPDYPEVAAAAIREMYRQVGDYELDDDGIMTRGVLVRHLILPANLENTYRVIDWFAETFRHGQAMFSLMSQYTPSGAQHFPEMRRLITHDEYDAAVRYLEKSGIEDGFYQDEPTYAEADWIPKFDGTGV